MKTRKSKFLERYKVFADEVLSSIAQVAAAGRTGDPDRIRAQRRRHHKRMAEIRAILGL